MLFLATSEEIAAIAFGCTVGIVAIIATAIRRSGQTKQREQSRREIAAYIAEGSMTPEQGERLMAAGEKPDQKN